MNIKELLELHNIMCDAARTLSKAKGADYSGSDDTLANLKRTEAMGIVPAIRGVLVRMCDKLSRLSQLTLPGAEAQVKDESIRDTLLDVINYAVLAQALRVDALVGKEAT